MPAKTAERVLCVSLGKSGSGKTFDLGIRLRTRLAELSQAKRWPYVFIHDAKVRRGEGWDSSTIGAIAPVSARFPAPSDLPVEAYPSRVMTFYRCEAEEVAALAWGHAEVDKGGTVLVVDELDRFPAKLERQMSAYKCLHYGRQYSLDIFGSTRRPANVDKAFFSEATSVRIFRLEGHLDLAVIRKCGWSNAEELASEVPNLKDRHYLPAE